LALLYPFQYQYQIVTILPKLNFEIIESPTPFIAGINQSFYEKFFEDHNFILEDSILVVDIDNKKVEMKNEKIKLPEFPSKYKKNLEKKLQEIVGKIIKKFRGEKPDKKPQKKGKANNTSQTESKKDGSSLNIGNTSSSENYPIGSAKSEALPVPKDMVNQADSEDEDYDVL
jgi:hypothetical protein